MRQVISTIMLLALASAGALAQEGWPQVHVKDIDGRTRALQHYAPREGVTLLVFWKTCCPNNITMIEELNAVWQEYDNPQQPVRVVLVSLDDQRTASKVKPIADTNGWQWEIIMDRNGELARMYNVIMPPQWIAADKDGNIVFRSKVTNGSLDSAIYFEDLTNQINTTN